MYVTIKNTLVTKSFSWILDFFDSLLSHILSKSAIFDGNRLYEGLSPKVYYLITKNMSLLSAIDLFFIFVLWGVCNYQKVDTSQLTFKRCRCKLGLIGCQYSRLNGQHHREGHKRDLQLRSE